MEPQNKQIYPDLNQQNQRISSNPYTYQSPEQYQPNFNFQQQPLPYNPFIPQISIKQHVIRSFKTWQKIIEETTQWVNSKIHVLRVISITVVFCHSTGAGQVTIFYNDSEEQKYKEFISNNVNRMLGAAMIQTPDSWEKHHKKLGESLVTLGSTGGIISISELEVDRSHGRALSIIWFRK